MCSPPATSVARRAFPSCWPASPWRPPTACSSRPRSTATTTATVSPTSSSTCWSRLPHDEADCVDASGHAFRERGRRSQGTETEERRPQSAPPEAMNESQVTVSGGRYKLPELFMSARDAEPDRAGGYLSAAEGAVGPLADACQDRPSERRAAQGAAEDDLRDTQRDRQGGERGAAESCIVALVASMRRPAEFDAWLQGRDHVLSSD